MFGLFAARPEVEYYSGTRFLPYPPDVSTNVPAFFFRLLAEAQCGTKPISLYQIDNNWVIQ
jgi:hypothetical protein